jgi:hypothetical protein
MRLSSQLNPGSGTTLEMGSREMVVWGISEGRKGQSQRKGVET